MSDEVPEADAAEQLRPAADPDVFDDDVFEDPDRRGAPLESNESDWHEQHLIVEDPDPDEIRWLVQESPPVLALPALSAAFRRLPRHYVFDPGAELGTGLRRGLQPQQRR